MRLLQKINDKITATAAETTDTYAYQPCFCMKNNGWTSFIFVLKFTGIK